jgi:hypothetical protein
MTPERRPSQVPPAGLAGPPGSADIDEASDDSFPASDPPAWSLSATISRTRNRFRLLADRYRNSERGGTGDGSGPDA